MPAIPERGRAADAILAELRERRRADTPWHDGKTFAYVFHARDDVADLAERAARMFLWDNALDPTAFPSLLALENEVVAMAAAHLHGAAGVVGNFTSGGTESVLLAVKTARDHARARRPDLGRAQIVVPATVHPAFHKACCYFDVDAVVTPVDPRTMRADVDAMRAAIGERTVLLVGSAPSYAHGVVDPIAEIAALALERDLLCHVDGCIGGFLLPFFAELGAPVTAFDFRVPGVTSMSMDFHKYAYAPKGASVVLYRDAALRRHQVFTWSGWPGYSMVNPTMQSTRSGGPLAGTWAVLQLLGRAGYRELAAGLRDARDRVIDGVAAIPGLRILGQPEMSLLAIAADVSVFRIADGLRRRGWTIHPQMRMGELPASLHLTITPINVPHLDELCADLAAITAEVRATPPGGALAGLRQALAAIDVDQLDDARLEQMLDLAGLGGGALPAGDMAEINEILDQLPPRVTDRLLAAFYGRISRPAALS
ncbi:MAG TPA: aspartate aminotransferase family protein [Kofleriaceae bacterium]|nr:aspartate aminotransferase family protein [Kofleriaceae bacterium]